MLPRKKHLGNCHALRNMFQAHYTELESPSGSIFLYPKTKYRFHVEVLGHGDHVRQIPANAEGFVYQIKGTKWRGYDCEAHRSVEDPRKIGTYCMVQMFQCTVTSRNPHGGRVEFIIDSSPGNALCKHSTGEHMMSQQSTLLVPESSGVTLTNEPGARSVFVIAEMPSGF